MMMSRCSPAGRLHITHPAGRLNAVGGVVVRKITVVSSATKKPSDARRPSGSTLARTDPLTMLHNRRVFDEQLQRELARALRFKREMCLVIIDLDLFKQVNDKHGHQAGDDALRATARILTAHTRTVDTVARIGGEEFALVFPETTLEDALSVTDRLRRSQETDGLHTTFSAGIAACPRHAVSEEELFKAADRALYQAKEKGRNRVEVFR